MNGDIDLKTLTDIIGACADRSETLRQLADPIAQEIRALRLGQLMLGEADGGLGFNLLEAMEIFEQLAREDASTAWLVWNSLLVCRFSRYMTEQLRAELFANPQALFCQSTRPMGVARPATEGVNVTGRWNLVSGCHHGDWALLTCMLDADAEDGPLVVAIPRSDFQIEDTWYSTGLRGSGSHDVVVDSVDVPGYRCFELRNSRQPADALDYLPVMVSITSLFAAQTLAVAQSTFDHVIQSARLAKPPIASVPLSGRFDAQYNLALHHSALRAAKRSLAVTAEAQWLQAENRQPVTPIGVSDLYGASLFAMKCARDAMADLDLLAGTAGIYAASPVERKFRDLQVMMKHIVAQPGMYADTGRVLLGTEPAWPAYGS